MSETREFPVAVVASLASGILLCDISDFHQAAEHLMGRPIFTHEFANKDLWREMQKEVLAQWPEAPVGWPKTISIRGGNGR